MSPYYRSVLLEALYGLDHLVWTYRSEVDHAPSASFTANDICLANYSERSAALIRDLIDDDNQRRGERPQFQPPTSPIKARLRMSIFSRRAAQAKGDAAAATSSTPPSTIAPIPDTSAPPGPDGDDVQLDEQRDAGFDSTGVVSSYPRPRPR